MDFEISYSDTTFDLLLTIDKAGSALLTIGSNRADPDFDKLGLFRGRVSQEHLNQLADAMRSAEFRQIENPESAASGEGVQQLRLKEGDVEIMKWVAYSSPIPPAFVSVEERMLAVVQTLRRNPALAMSVSCAGFPMTLERDKPARITVTITNPGSGTLKLQQPQDWSRDVANLRLMALRSDISMAELADYHQQLVDFSVENIVDITGAQIDKQLIVLAPGASVQYTVGLTPDWPPGDYHLEFLYAASLLDQDGQEQIRCAFLTRPYAVTMTGKAKPGDVPKEDGDGHDR